MIAILEYGGYETLSVSIAMAILYSSALKDLGNAPSMREEVRNICGASDLTLLSYRIHHEGLLPAAKHVPVSATSTLHGKSRPGGVMHLHKWLPPEPRYECE